MKNVFCNKCGLTKGPFTFYPNYQSNGIICKKCWIKKNKGYFNKTIEGE